MLISTMLYLIEILHQTTTARRRSASNAGCILSKFYIKPQQLTPYRQPGEVVSYRNSTSNHNRAFRRIDEKRLYLIEILHQTTTFAVHLQTFVELYLIEILHQTTTAHAVSTTRRSCILSKFYIKPQPGCGCRALWFVVSYRNSTSNHNDVRSNPLAVPVVSYRNSTSNHNEILADDGFESLYLIEILHQTTTQRAHHKAKQELYLIEILHQTTTLLLLRFSFRGCILSKFYIKPQLEVVHRLQPRRCILSKFYIKPQPRTAQQEERHELYLIEILHQTTTCSKLL